MELQRVFNSSIAFAFEKFCPGDECINDVVKGQAEDYDVLKHVNGLINSFNSDPEFKDLADMVANDAKDGDLIDGTERIDMLIDQEEPLDDGDIDGGISWLSDWIGMFFEGDDYYYGDYHHY